MPTTTIQQHRCKKPKFIVTILNMHHIGDSNSSNSKCTLWFQLFIYCHQAGYFELSLWFFFKISCRCWISSTFPQRLLVSYVTTVAFPCLVILYNSCMLGLVVFKLWRLRKGEGGDGWNKMNREKGSRLRKDCATVLGLSCVLGLPWWLASSTYMSLSGIYIFTILNSLQGQYEQDPHIA